MVMAVLMPGMALAASANIYVSPSSKSVTRGHSFTMQVRVNSGSDQVDAAQARLNFDSSKLQYVSYSAGSFSTLTTSAGNGYFEYVGFVTSPVTSDQLLLSVTFKAIMSGATSLSLSNAQAAYSGAHLSTSTSGSTVTVNEPAGLPTAPPPSSTTPKPRTAAGLGTAAVGDKTPPALVGEAGIDKTQSTIKLTFKTGEASTVKLQYGVDGATKKSTAINEVKTDHTITLGTEKPLIPGTTYKLELTLTDQSGNASAVQFYDIRTVGVAYSVRIVDKSGQPLANHPVRLFSDPIDATTDTDGVAKFADVTPGEHILAFEIDGITIRQPVLVGAEVQSQGGDGAQRQTINLPFQLARANSAKTFLPWQWLAVGLLVGAGLAKFPAKTAFSRLLLLKDTLGKKS